MSLLSTFTLSGLAGTLTPNGVKKCIEACNTIVTPISVTNHYPLFIAGILPDTGLFPLDFNVIEINRARM